MISVSENHARRRRLSLPVPAELSLGYSIFGTFPRSSSTDLDDDVDEPFQASGEVSPRPPPSFRDRSRSEPSFQAFVRREEVVPWGQELRRISDEFHSSYSFDVRPLGRISESNGDAIAPPPSEGHAFSFPGARGTWFHSIYQRLTRPITRAPTRGRAYSEGDPPT